MDEYDGPSAPAILMRTGFAIFPLQFFPFTATRRRFTANVITLEATPVNLTLL